MNLFPSSFLQKWFHNLERGFLYPMLPSFSCTCLSCIIESDNRNMNHNILVCFLLSQLMLCYRARCGCPKEFECGTLGSMSFPFTNLPNPDCGFFFVNCSALPYPTVKLWAEQDWLLEIVHQQFHELKIHFPYKNCNSFGQSFPNNSAISFKLQSNSSMLKCQNSSYYMDKQVVPPGYTKFGNCEQEYSFNIYYNYTNGRFFNYTGGTPHGCSIIKMPMKNRNFSLEDKVELYNLLADEWVLEWNFTESCQNCLNRGHRCEVDQFNNFQCAIEINKTKDVFRLTVIAGLTCSLIICFIIWCCKKRITGYSSPIQHFCKTKTKNNQDIENMLRNFGSVVPKRYKFRNVKRMTKSFKIKLGQGGYGSVFKGFLDDNTPVAVKLLVSSEGNGEEFINEVASISRTSHVNIVKLLGFCFEGDKRALVYEFMPNGSLEKFIYDDKFLVVRQLGWETLFNISIDIARGLEYLHRGCSTRIVHFDIKPHNILLDQDFCPKISDFGLSKLCTRKESIESLTGIRGTIGYIAPEVVCKGFGNVSHKSDVYSYGMMILEMVGGRKNVDDRVENDSQIYFPHWIYSKLEKNQELGEIVDDTGNESAKKMIMTSLWCIQADPCLRPTMSRVVEMLEGKLDLLQIPPKPYLFSHFGSSATSTSALIL